MRYKLSAGNVLLVLIVGALSCLSALADDEEKVRFHWSPLHRAELRKAVVSWDSVESGAPCLSPYQKHSEDALAALQIALAFGELPVGTYTYIKPEDSRLDHSPFVEGLKDSIPFRFTKEHQILMRFMTVEKSESWQTDDELIGVDPKRPYGDFTYFELEMAAHLRLPTRSNSEGHKEIDKKTEERLRELHETMEAALQVYLQNFTLKDGSFEGEPYYGIWERVE